MGIIEICTANLQSVQAAIAAGAARVELCAALEVGGLTPSAGLIEASVASGPIEVCVLIRPRAGHFQYNSAEIKLMCRDIDFCRKAGASGVVVGALTDTNALDIVALQAMKNAAGDMEIILHRAFDFLAEPEDALPVLIQMGYCRILTSGQQPSAWEGRAALAHWVKHFGNDITIMPGSGINSANIAALKAATNATDFHLSAKKKWPGPVMSLPGLDPGFEVSDVAEIELIRSLSG